MLGGYVKKGHSYKTGIYHRTSKNYPRGCPYCRHGKVIVGNNDLKTLRPEIAEQWDYELNVDANGNRLRPEQFSEHNGYRAWWKCKFGHSWQSKIASRTTDNTGCPFCVGNSTSFAEQFIYYYLIKAGLSVKNRVKINGIEYDIAIKELNMLIEYNSIYHKGKDEIDENKALQCKRLGVNFVVIEEDYNNSVSVQNNYYCYPGINHGKTSDLIDIIEDIIKDTKYSNNVRKEHLAEIRAQAFRSSRSNVVKIEESLANRFPEVAKMWDTTMNNGITPNDVTAYSSYEAYWNIDNKIYLRKIKDVVGNYIKKQKYK